MKRTRSTCPPRPWQPAALLALAGLSALAGCATTAQQPAPEHGPSLEVSVGRIAERLVRAAELRTDLRTLRTRIDSIEPEQGSADRLAADESARIGTVLRREFLLVLANDIYIVDSDSDADDAAAAPAATHQLVGDYVRMGDDLFLSMRLVDTSTHVIVAAVRGPIPLDAIGDLAEPEARVAAVVVPTSGAESILPAPVAQNTTTALLTETPWTMPAEEIPEFVPLEDEPRYLDSPPLRTKEAAVEPPVDPPVEKDFQVWRAKRLAEQGPAAGEGIMPGAEDPADIAESYEEWRRRKLADRSTSQPDPVRPQVDRAGTPVSGAGGDPRYPWRNAQLDRLLGIPADDSAAGQAPGKRPWRTRELAEILGVPPEK